jgi:Skp family chaperone for outer membrane proteins
VLGFAPTLLMAATVIAQPPKLAIVDVQHAMDATPHWKQAVSVLQKQRAEKQSALEAKQKELKQKKEKLDAQRAVSDPNTSAEAEEALMKDADELTQGFLQSQKELTEREKKYTDQMLSRIELIVRDLALEGNYDFVFESGNKDNPNVLYAPKAADLTQRVISEYIKRFKDKPLE